MPALGVSKVNGSVVLLPLGFERGDDLLWCPDPVNGQYSRRWVGGSGQQSLYPPRNRPSLALHFLRDEIASLFRKGHLLSPPHAAGVDAAVDHLSSVFERVELIGLTIVPLPYAQLARWICLAFLVGIPLNTMSIAWAKALKFESMGPGSGEALDDDCADEPAPPPARSLCCRMLRWGETKPCLRWGRKARDA